MDATCPRCGQPDVAGDACPRCGASISQYRAELEARVAAAHWPATPPPAAPRATAVSTRPAGFWIRAVAVVIDGMVLLGARAALAAVAWVVFGEAAATRPVRAAVGFVTAVGGAAYWVLFHAFHGQTLGKMAVGVRVVALDGRPITLSQALLRLVGYWVSSVVFGIGYLVAGVRRDKRALHDLIAGTRVERLP
jgi:uncharacterized RDD family membrane protein YckC